MKMETFNWLSLILCWISYSYGAPSSEKVLCYDCHYDPSTLRLKQDGTWASTGKGGFPPCALRNEDDADVLNKYGCSKGVCFIRKDSNGQVFRGCADPWNLPWGIDSKRNCEKQGYSDSTWWFCEGDLCNNGEIHQENRCEDSSDNAPDTSEEYEYNYVEKIYRNEDTYQEYNQQQEVVSPGYVEDENPWSSYHEDHGYGNPWENQEPYEAPQPVVEVPAPAPVPAPSEITAPNYVPSQPADNSGMYESVYGFEYSTPNSGPEYSNNAANNVWAQREEPDRSASDDNSNVYYSRIHEKYVTYDRAAPPIHHYTDSEQSYQTDGGSVSMYDYPANEYEASYDQPLPQTTYDPFADDASYKEEPVKYYEYEPESYDNLIYPDLKAQEANEDEYITETYSYTDVDEDVDNIQEVAEEPNLAEATYPVEALPQHEYTNENNWYAEEEETVLNNQPAYQWNPHSWLPWLGYPRHHYGLPHSASHSLALNDETTQEPQLDLKAWNGQVNYQPLTEVPQTKKSHSPPKKSHPAHKKSFEPTPVKSHPALKKSHQPAPKKSHPLPKNSYKPEPKQSYEPAPKKSHPPPKQSYQPEPKKSYQPAPKKSHPLPKKSYEPEPKKSYEPAPKKSHPPPKQPYQPEPNKSHQPAPKKSHPLPKKSYEPEPKKSHQPAPKKSHPPAKKSYQPEPKKSHPPAKKSYQPEQKKSHPPPKKSYQPAPKKSHPLPKKSYQPEPKKSYQPAPKKSHPVPNKSHEPAPKKSQPAPKKSHEPEPKKSHPAPEKSYEPEPKKSHPSPNKSSPSGKSNEEVAGKKVFEPENVRPSRDENTAYVLGDNLQVLGGNLIPTDNDQVDYDEYEYTTDSDGEVEYYYYTDVDGDNEIDDEKREEETQPSYYEHSYKPPTLSSALLDVCDGTCYNNPSRLYAHPEDSSKFVQCADGIMFNKPCVCCRPHVHSCPHTTTFDKFLGLCSPNGDSSYEHTQYKPIEY